MSLIQGMLLVVFLVVGGWCQCDDGQLVPLEYVGVGDICDEMSTEGLFQVCDNYAACRLKEGTNYSTCQSGGKGQYADYPYGRNCESDNDCFEPQECVNNDDSGILVCDYRRMPNGYGCERDTQCSSGFCVNSTCDPGPKEDTDGCLRDHDCSVGLFCDINRECVPSLKQGERCDAYSESTNSDSQVCDKGLGCFPDGREGRQHTCQPIFSASLGTHCGKNPYFCQPQYFCSPQTRECSSYPSERSSKVKCDSNAIGVCPIGSRCTCSGTVTQETESSFVCEEFSNGACVKMLNNYYECLANCYFDPFTIANNDESPLPSEFLPPLNRFSCAAMKCQEEYNSVVKCQNDDSRVYADSGFSPVRVPDWAHYYEKTFEGWQLFVLVLICLVGVTLTVSLVVLINRYKGGYETYV